MNLLTVKPRRIALASNFYRGAQLPYGVTMTGLSLATPFAGTPYNTSTLTIGSSRYNAATTLTVSNTGSTGRTDFLAHLATVAANANDYRIIVPAGTLSGGAYTLPAKTDPTKHCWIVATTVHAGTFSTPIGTKIPTNQTGLTTFEGANSTQDYVMSFADSAAARGYSLHGLQVQPNGNNTIQLGIIGFRRTVGQTTIADYPGELFIDRCWIKGGTGGSVRRGVLANGPYFKIHDSRITDVHTVGNESAGIGSWTSGRYHEHKRCTIEAGAQAILSGGADPDNANTGLLDPSDWFSEEIYAFKPLSWLPVHPDYAGTHWLAKTGNEAKNVRRWVINNSRTRNNWADGQNGFGMLFQGLSDNNTNYDHTTIQDIVVRNHHFDYCLQGVNISSRVSYDGPTLTNPGRRIVLDNILQTRNGGERGEPVAYLKNGNSGTYGTAYQPVGDLRDLVIDRGTADGDKWLSLEGPDAESWTITNQIARGGSYCISRTNGPSGRAGVEASCAVNLNYDGNVVYDYSEGGGSFASFAPGCDANETNSSMAFMDYAGYDYRLTTQQLTKGVGGGRPGADIDTLLSQLTNVI